MTKWRKRFAWWPLLARHAEGGRRLIWLESYFCKCERAGEGWRFVSVSVDGAVRRGRVRPLFLR